MGHQGGRFRDQEQESAGAGDASVTNCRSPPIGDPIDYGGVSTELIPLVDVCQLWHIEPPSLHRHRRLRPLRLLLADAEEMTTVA